MYYSIYIAWIKAMERYNRSDKKKAYKRKNNSREFYHLFSKANNITPNEMSSILRTIVSVQIVRITAHALVPLVLR